MNNAKLTRKERAEAQKKERDLYLTLSKLLLRLDELKDYVGKVAIRESWNSGEFAINVAIGKINIKKILLHPSCENPSTVELILKDQDMTICLEPENDRREINSVVEKIVVILREKLDKYFQNKKTILSQILE